jgi:hypothetical protein
VGGGVDPQRQAGDDAQAGAGQRLGEGFGIGPALHAGVAAADHRQRRRGQPRRIPFYIEQQRRIGNGGQQRRIAGLAQRQHRMAGRVLPAQGGIEQASEIGKGCGRRRLRQRLRHGRADVGAHGVEAGGQDRFGAAEGVEQDAGRARTDAGRAVQAQPGGQPRWSK